MDQNYFRKNIEDIIKNCYVNLETEEKAGFKLAIENNNIISITNTVPVLQDGLFFEIKDVYWV